MGSPGVILGLKGVFGCWGKRNMGTMTSSSIKSKFVRSYDNTRFDRPYKRNVCIHERLTCVTIELIIFT